MSVDPQDITIAELVARYDAHATAYYRRLDGSLTAEHHNIVLAMRPLLKLYADCPAARFGPRSLKAVRQAMIASGWGRRHINQQIGRIKRMFRWATDSELVAGNTYHALAAVAGLKAGRSEARETEPVLPVPDAIVEATVACMPPMLAAMVRLQRATGMRPGEVCSMRTCDVSASGAIWVYRPVAHKMAYTGRNREVYIGPKAQQILKPYLKRQTREPVFTPAEVQAERLEARHAARVTPLSCGNKPGTNRVKRPKRKPGEQYTAATYAKAIAFACDQAFPFEPGGQQDGETAEQYASRTLAERKAWQKDHRWAPNRLRHSFGTDVRRQYGLEAAQVLLGHARADVTQLYAELSTEARVESGRKDRLTALHRPHQIQTLRKGDRALSPFKTVHLRHATNFVVTALSQKRFMCCNVRVA